MQRNGGSSRLDMDTLLPPSADGGRSTPDDRQDETLLVVAQSDVFSSDHRDFLMFSARYQQDRRNLVMLGVGGLPAFCGWRSAQASESSAHPDAASGKARQVLVIFEQGGISHVDTWDPKPEMPTEHASPFKTISTNVPGVFLTELFHKTASHMDKLSIVRCMTQPTPGISNSHPKGSQYVFSGEAPGGPEEMPDIGSVVTSRMGTAARHLPGYIMVPGTDEQQENTRLGFLPPAYKVFKTGGQPHLSDWTVPNLGLLGVDDRRFKARTDMLSRLDLGISGVQTSDTKALVSLRQQAADMLTNPGTRKAFDLKSEPELVRAKYGIGHRGQCYLLGRKLIEAGVRLVTIDCREPPADAYPGGSNMNWDHHDFIYSTGSTEIAGGGAGAGRWGIGTWPMMGSTDQAFAALLEDLAERGLLQETLVCFVTEFGRTPRINERKGRDHWTHAFSIAFAGAGVPGGQVIGSTDREGGFITSSVAYTLDDYAATIYEKLGIDRTQPLYTAANRPIMLARKGNPIQELC